MPIRRSIITIGDSKGITLPKSWIEFIEKLTGTELKEVALEVDTVLTILPVVDGVPVRLKGEFKKQEGED